MAATSIHAITVTQVRALAYITNENKTEQGTLIESFGCSKNPDEAEKAFLQIQNSMGTGRNKVLAQHIVQSFRPGEITPQKALEIGKELCDRLLKDQYQYVLAVHTDKKHIHCHIVFNNINMENGKSFSYLEDRGKKKSWETIRTLSDEICKENGLSVIRNPEKNKGKSWYEWDKNKQGQSWKTQLKFAIDECIMESKNFEDFLKKISGKNIEVYYNPEHKINLKFRMEGQQKWSRAKTLGWFYETPQIKKRIEQFQIFKTGHPTEKQQTRIIDTLDEKYQNSKGLERWADIQNMKEASKVINILTNLGVENTSEIEKKSIGTFSERMNLVSSLNGVQHDIENLSEQISAVRKIKKYKPVNDEFKAQTSKKSRQKFAEKYSQDLEKYKASAAFLRSIYTDGKVPSEKQLKEQRDELVEKRNSLNEQYKTVCQQLKELDFARQTVEDYFLQKERENKLKKDKDNLE